MATCKKIRYTTRDVARKMRDRMRGVRSPEKLRPYLCSDCGFWHLGHLPPAILHGHATRAEVYGDRK